MKDLVSCQEKVDNMRGAFLVDKGAPFKNHLITLIDDIYESGVTLQELAHTLQQSGARIQGLAITKTLTDPC